MNILDSKDDNLPTTKMTIIEGHCWKCKQPMNVAFTEGDGITSSHNGPDEFSEVELEFAKSKGVLIQKQNSKMAGYSYLANTCPHCQNFVGDHYLFTQYISPADLGEYKSTQYDVGNSSILPPF